MKKNIVILICIILIIALLLFIIVQVNKRDVDEKGVVSVQNNLNETKNNETTAEEQETILKGNFGEINRIFKEGSIKNTGATILLINRTNICMSYDYWFAIEKKVNNQWKLLKLKGDLAIDALGRIISPNQSREIKLDWTTAYGKLKKGEYRLVLEDYSGENPYYYMEFSIK